MIYLQQFLAIAGVVSRRGATDLIKAGKVKVNGKRAEAGQKIDSKKDKVELNGKIVKAEEKFVYYAVNKPVGYTCTTRSFDGERKVTNLVPRVPRVWPVGRLDKDSHGLIILTNDGELTNKLTHPKFEHEKEYVVLLSRDIENDFLEKLKKGVKLKEGTARVDRVWIVDKRKINLVIHQGWNRQIRRMLGAFNYKVEDLERVRVGKYKLGNIKLGKYEQLKG